MCAYYFFLDLIWLREEAKTTRTPSPVVVEKTPTPPPPPSPPTPEVPEDPYDRRLRKARAQMDMSKSAAFLAVEELVKAQQTHMRLKRQFQEAKMEEDIKNRRQVRVCLDGLLEFYLDLWHIMYY